ncbi:MAG TPA: phosphate butyryltransferase [candidate division Zixibacteria bacterium]|nr:phosphate butyryltransferase [candidate division Zixibacteria bacterium]
MLKSFDQIIEKATGAKKRLVVADASGGSVIEALQQAEKLGMIDPILVGDEAKIAPLIEQFGLSSFTIYNETNPQAIGEKSVALVRSGEGDMLMKGKLSTPILMRAVLDKENGLRKGKLLSHAALMGMPNYPKLVLMTDGGIVISPTIDEKVAILENAVELSYSLGIELPKVACLAAIENVDPKQAATTDAAMLVRMAIRKQLKPMIVEGPVAMDVILSKEAAKAKGIDSAISEDADIILMPDITTGNAVAKALIHIAGAKIGGLVLGAACPIVLLSRSDTAEIKLFSIATACSMCK